MAEKIIIQKYDTCPCCGKEVPKGSLVYNYEEEIVVCVDCASYL